MIAISLSAGVHVGVALMALFFSPTFTQQSAPLEQGAIELLMVEKAGAEPTRGSRDGVTTRSPRAEAVRPEEDSPNAQKVASGRSFLPAARDDPAAQLSPQVPRIGSRPETKPPSQNIQAHPLPSNKQTAPVFHLEGTESESNVVAFGDRILPAMPDNRFRNRPPIYPAEAQIRGDHGSVVLVIHVAQNGVAIGADVIASSGVESLDAAARAAVLKWHFHPALQNGQTVPFDMPFRFVFEAD